MSRRCLGHSEGEGGTLRRCRLENGHTCQCEYVLARSVLMAPRVTRKVLA